MKKISILAGLILFATLGFSQTASRNRIKTYNSYGWNQRVVPVFAFLDSTLKAFHNIKDDGTSWVLKGNALGSNTVFIGSTDNRSLLLKTNDLLRAKIDSIGTVRISNGLSIGDAVINPSVISLYVNKNITGNTDFYQNYSEGDIKRDVTSGVIMYQSAPSSENYTFTTIALTHYDAANLGKGASHTVTTQQGFNVGNLTSGVNNRGFVGQLTSGANKFNLYMSGTAQNIIAGNTRIGSMIAPTATLDVTGTMSVSLSANINGSMNIGPSVNTQTISKIRLAPTSTEMLDIGGDGAGSLYIWTHRPASKTTTNYNIFMDEYDNLFNDSSSHQFRFNNVAAFNITNSVLNNTGSSFVRLTPKSHQKTTLAEYNDIVSQPSTVGFNTAGGTLATQRQNLYGAKTYSAAAASTLTNPYNSWFAKGVASTNVSIINNWGFGTDGSALVTQSLVLGKTAATPVANLDVTGTASISGTTMLNNLGTSMIGTVQIAGAITNTAVLDFPSTGANSFSDLTVTLTGAALYDAVILGIGNAAMTGIGTFQYWVSAANTVSIRFSNPDGGALDPASDTFKVTVIKN